MNNIDLYFEAAVFQCSIYIYSISLKWLKVEKFFNSLMPFMAVIIERSFTLKESVTSACSLIYSGMFESLLFAESCP